MKYVFIFFAFCLCVLVGYAVSLKYTKRRNFFQSLVDLSTKLSLDINFSRDKLKNLIENYDNSSKKFLCGVDEKFLSYLAKKEELNSNVMFKDCEFLKNDEKDLVLLFFKALGRSDVENQTKEIKNFGEKFSQIKDICEVEKKKFGGLSLKLGIVAGLFLAIIMF